MKPCRRCGLDNADDRMFCQQCGRRFDDASPADGTLRWSGGVQTPGGTRRRVPVDVFTSGSGQLHRSVPIDDLFAFKDKLVIGRAANCDICLPHPSVSRTHALLERLPQGGLRVRDLDSINGVLVSGRRVADPVIIKEQERFGIGPYLFCISGGHVHSLDSSQSLRLEARSLEKVVRLRKGQVRKLLENINLAIEPGEFISLLGPSGSGKSTLMDCLNGRRPATGGRVLANGEDFYRHFDSFRQSLGYVPQRDIVHTQLTVYKALYYTARLRLPTDTEPTELQTRIREVLRMMELEPHQETMVANLSGGQIKRVSLGAELLARPCLLYIDEATSGLDAGTEARMMRLFRQLADEGKSVICITHNVDHVDLCNLILVLSGGRLVFYGPPVEGLSYFRVGRISEIYDRLAEKTPVAWEQEFAGSSLHKEFVEKRLASAPAESILAPLTPALMPGSAPAMPAEEVQSERPHRLLGHQFLILTTRYAELVWRDPRTLRLLLLQAPLVALFVLLGFANKPYEQTILVPRKLTDSERQTLALWIDRMETAQASGQVAKPVVPEGEGAEQLQVLLQKLDWSTDKARMVLDSEAPVVPERVIVNPRYTYMLLFILAIANLWFGCNNAAREIVKEESIYTRERAVNLGIFPYLASKFLVLSVISAVQTLLLMLVIYGVLEILHLTLGHEMPPALYRLDMFSQYAVLLLLSMTGVAMGLLLSACVNNPDRATTLLPYVLIPQIILGGGIMPVREGLLHILALLVSPTYWAYRGLRRGATELPAEFPWYADYNDSAWIACAALTAQMLVMLLLTAWFLRQKDVRKG